MKSVLITSSILILLTAALRPLLRGKIPPKVQYALWLVTALRLLLPVNLFTSAYSALALLEQADDPPQIIQAIGETTVPAMSYQDAYDQALQEYEKQIERGELVPHISQAEIVNNRTSELMQGPTVAELAAKYAKPVWLTGAAIMGAWFLLVNAQLRRKLKSAKRLDGVDCLLPVYVSDALPSPCLCGTIRPAIYVTPAALESPDRLRHVLAHELTHYRHRDHWWALVRCVCLCAYWFDPLVWVAAALSRQDCELACDEGAIRALGEGERIPYGRTLVAMIAAGRNSLLQTATTMTGGKKRVRERVQLIARKPKTVAAVALALVVIIACAVGCTFTGAPEDSPAPGDPSPSATPSLEPDAERPTLDTLQERLDDIPEELREDVVNRRVEAVAATGQSNILAAYNLDVYDPLWGMLLWVYQWDQVEFEDWLYTIETGAFDVFARDSEHYYATLRPTSVQVDEEDYERWTALQKPIGDYARQQVLNTQGVEAFDADELRSRDSLWEGKTYTEVAYWPYKEINGDTDIVWIYRLVQLADQGPSGVWIPEQVQHIDAAVDPTPQHIKPREAEGMTVTEYAAQLQQEADNGNAAWATDPIDAARHYIAGTDNPDSIPLDSFTDNSAVIEAAVAGMGPTEEQQAIQAVMDKILAADQLSLSLAPGGTSRVYAYAIPGLTNWEGSEGFWAYRLGIFATEYRWERLDALPDGMNATCLTIQPEGGPDCLWLWDAFNLMGVRTQDNQIEYYQAVSNSYGDPLDTDIWNRGPFGYIRWWFDEVELSLLRTTSVPDRGQSHIEVVNEWIDGFEGAMTKCASGSTYACTYVQPRNVVADAHSGLSQEDLENFAQSRGEGRSAEDYGKTWFTFYYSLVFVPENETAKAYLEAGNTEDYTGDDAPEGAQICQRVAYMWLNDGQWVCEGAGTGW